MVSILVLVLYISGVIRSVSLDAAPVSLFSISRIDSKSISVGNLLFSIS